MTDNNLIPVNPDGTNQYTGPVTPRRPRDEIEADLATAKAAIAARDTALARQASRAREVLTQVIFENAMGFGLTEEHEGSRDLDSARETADALLTAKHL